MKLPKGASRELVSLSIIAFMPTWSGAESVTITEGSSLSGTLYENHNGYTGNFDTAANRLFVRQTSDIRHSMAVLKFDLSGVSISSDNIDDVNITLTTHSATTAVQTRTLAVYNGDDSLITSGILYDAANPLIDDSYIPEDDDDNDFDAALVSDLMTYSNASGDLTPDVIGSGNADLLNAVKAAMDDPSDQVLTVVIYGGSSQYITYSGSEAVVERRPVLNLLGDTDGDGLPNDWEIANGLDPNDDGSVDPNNGAAGDPDLDGFDNAAELDAGSDPQSNLSTPLDIDADGLADAWEIENFGNIGVTGATDDPDEDGFDNEAEESGLPVPSDPNNAMSVPGQADFDGLDDQWEIDNFGDIVSYNGLHDPDGDIYTNEEEETADSDPLDRYDFIEDEDDDGQNDRWERRFFGDLTTSDDPFNDDTDMDGVWVNDDEYFFGSDPANALSVPDDLDGDSLDDGFELVYFPNIWDFDANDDPDLDYSTNGEEEDALSNPIVRSSSPDTDGDGLGDGWEVFSFGNLTTTEDPADDNEPDTFDNASEYAAASSGSDSSDSPDIDGDRLPDAFEIATWGSIETQSGADDSDGGGTSNLVEYLAGTDANDGGVDDVEPGIITTAVGGGADTMISNDDQGSSYAPTATHGTRTIMEVRQGSTRLRYMMLRFDVSGLGGDLENTMLKLNALSTRTRDITVYGLVDGDPGENWNEETTSWATSPGLEAAEQFDAKLYTFPRDPQRLRRIGTFRTEQGVVGSYYSSPRTLDLKSFIESDSDGLITLVLQVDTANNTTSYTSKEGAVAEGDMSLAPTLVVPRGSVTVPANLQIVSATFDSESNTFAIEVSGLEAGQSYHAQWSEVLEGFTPVDGSDFVASGPVESISLSADELENPAIFFRIADGVGSP